LMYKSKRYSAESTHTSQVSQFSVKGEDGSGMLVNCVVFIGVVED